MIFEVGSPSLCMKSNFDSTIFRVVTLHPIPFQLETGLFIIWELKQSNLVYTDTGGHTCRKCPY